MTPLIGFIRAIITQVLLDADCIVVSQSNLEKNLYSYQGISSLFLRKNLRYNFNFLIVE